MLGARDLKEGGQDIHERHELAADAAGGDRGRVVHQRRGAKSAFGERTLQIPEGRGGGFSEAPPVVDERIAAPEVLQAVVDGIRIVRRPAAGGHAPRIHAVLAARSAMVRREHDDRIVQLTALFQELHDSPDAHVEVFEHPGEDLLGAGIAALLLGAQVRPGLHHRLESVERGPGGQDADFGGAREALFPERIVTFVVAARITVEPVVR